MTTAKYAIMAALVSLAVNIFPARAADVYARSERVMPLRRETTGVHSGETLGAAALWEKFTALVRNGRMREAYQCFSPLSQDVFSFGEFCTQYNPVTAIHEAILSPVDDGQLRLSGDIAQLRFISAPRQERAVPTPPSMKDNGITEDMRPREPGSLVQALLVKEGGRWYLVAARRQAAARIEAETRNFLRKICNTPAVNIILQRGMPGGKDQSVRKVVPELFNTPEATLCCHYYDFSFRDTMGANEIRATARKKGIRPFTIDANGNIRSADKPGGARTVPSSGEEPTGKSELAQSGKTAKEEDVTVPPLTVPEVAGGQKETLQKQAYAPPSLPPLPGDAQGADASQGLRFGSKVARADAVSKGGSSKSLPGGLDAGEFGITDTASAADQKQDDELAGLALPGTPAGQKEKAGNKISSMKPLNEWEKWPDGNWNPDNPGRPNRRISSARTPRVTGQAPDMGDPEKQALGPAQATAVPAAEVARQKAMAEAWGTLPTPAEDGGEVKPGRKNIPALSTGEFGTSEELPPLPSQTINTKEAAPSQQADSEDKELLPPPPPALQEGVVRKAEVQKTEAEKAEEKSPKKSKGSAAASWVDENERVFREKRAAMTPPSLPPIPTEDPAALDGASNPSAPPPDMGDPEAKKDSTGLPSALNKDDL